MKIVISPDSFKESLSALAAAEAIRDGIQAVLDDAQCDCIPLADGGEGTVAALIAATNGSSMTATVMGPLGEPVNASYGLLGDGLSAVIEMAQASGLALVPPARRDPAVTTSYGTGELIRTALDHRIRRIIIGIGGSATVDGGAGLIQALGVRFSDRDGRTIDAALAGGDLGRIARIDTSALDARLREVEIEVACDVDNPLLGNNGAAATFGPQKGASDETIAILEAGLANYYGLVERELQVSVIGRAGAGAAGGVGAALLAFVDAALRPGIDIVMEATGLRERIARADLVITGEGRIDAQTLRGKTASGVARLATSLGVPVVAVGGSLAGDAERLFDHGFDALEAAVCEPMTTREALEGARRNLVRAGRRIGAWLILGQRLKSRPDVG